MSAFYTRFISWFRWLPWFLVAYVVFVLPWYFPPQQAVDAESYTFGFRNGIAQLGLAVGLVLMLALRLCDARAVAADRLLKTALCEPAPASARSKIWTGVLIFLVLAAVGGWWLYIPSPYFGETTYFLPKLDLMLLGRIPYRDFDFGYGPLMLYGPCWLHWLSGGYIPIDSAYIVTLLLHYALGIAAIEFITRCFVLSERWRLGILALAALASTNLSLGVIYTPLRFIFPLWVAFFINWKLRVVPRFAWIWALVCPAIGFGISPECGIVSFLVVVTAIVWRWRAERWRVFLPMLACCASLLATWLLFGSPYFAMIGLFGGGAFNFPILPTPYMIALLLVACRFLPRVAVVALRDENPGAGLCASLLLATGLFLPAALGRCDPGHVLFNSLGLLLVATALGASDVRRPVRLLGPVGSFVIVIITQVSMWNHYEWRVGQAIEIRRIISEDKVTLWAVDEEVRAKIRDQPGAHDFHWSKQLPLQRELLELLPYSRLSTPFGCSAEIDHFLKLAGRDFPDYWVPGTSGVFNEEAVARRVAALSACPYLLVPKSATRFLQISESYPEDYSKYLGQLFVFPTRMRVVHPPFSAEAEMIKALVQGYDIKGTFRNYLILARKSAPEPAPITSN